MRAALVMAVLGVLLMVAGSSLYDWRLGLIVAGGFLVAFGLLVDFEGDE
jgi:cytochrome c biogenesis protein CcdA